MKWMMEIIELSKMNEKTVENEKKKKKKKTVKMREWAEELGVCHHHSYYCIAVGDRRKK